MHGTISLLRSDIQSSCQCVLLETSRNFHTKMSRPARWVCDLIGLRQLHRGRLDPSSQSGHIGSRCSCFSHTEYSGFWLRGLDDLSPWKDAVKLGFFSDLPCCLQSGGRLCETHESVQGLNKVTPVAATSLVLRVTRVRSCSNRGRGQQSIDHRHVQAPWRLPDRKSVPNDGQLLGRCLVSGRKNVAADLY